MTTGTVQWFNASKGCGVIKPVDGGFNVVVLIGAVQRAGFLDLKEGQIVNFDIVVDEATGKLFAENLAIQVSGSSALDAPAGSGLGGRFLSALRLANDEKRV
jgi:CspA family cold shock protein